MLSKLLKYDFAALSRVLVPVHLAVVVAGAAALACFGFARVLGEGSAARALEPFVALGFAAGGTCTLAVGAAPVATFVVVVRRWYANLFTDEGYLTLTLPVDARVHVASKMIAGFTWMVVDLALLCAFFLGVMGVLSGDLAGTFAGLFPANGLDGLMAWGKGALQIVAGLGQVLAAVLMAYAAFALGTVLAARHRVAAGVGLFVGASWALGLLSAFVSVTGAYAVYRDSYFSALSFPPPLMGLVVSAATLILSLAASAALFALCVYLLKNRVNLP